MRKRILLAMALATTLSYTAMAHSPLKSTSPENNAELTVVPEGIKMTFGKPARITKVMLIHTAGENSHADKLKLPSKQFETSFDLLPKFRGEGSYKVNWRALSKDGHALKGSFSFTVAK